MNRNKFTRREIQILKSNPYTYRVTESQIFFTKEFRKNSGGDTRKERARGISSKCSVTTRICWEQADYPAFR